MKRTVFSLVTLALVALAASCSKDNETLDTKKSVCEIGNTGKVATSFN